MAMPFEKRAPDDIITYRLFVPVASPLVGMSMDSLVSQCKDYISLLSANFLWHKEDLQLNVTDRLSEPLPDGFRPLILHGSTNFGENIEDEWFAVSLLTRLADQFQLVLQLSDGDGELLLIEAAEVLPAWVKPDVCQHRVFWYTRALHLIPLPTAPSDFGHLPLGACTLAQGLALTTSLRDTTASIAVQSVLAARLHKYTEADFIVRHHHSAQLRLPPRAVKVLHTYPELATQAVTAFAFRDPMEMRSAVKLTHFPPVDNVLQSVRLTRFSYAQLSHAQCKPPAAFGRMPSSQHPDFKASMLGCFLTLGLDILAQQGSSRIVQSADDGLQHDDRWQGYLRNLEQHGYFEELLKGSQGHTLKLEQAKAHFWNHVGRESDKDDKDEGITLTSQERAARTCYSLLQHVDGLPMPPLSSQDDDDAWMVVNDAQLHQLLESYKHQAAAMGGHAPGDATMTNVVDRLSTFVESQTSDLEGLETGPDSHADNSDDEEGLMAPPDDVEVDADNFMSLLQSMLSLGPNEAESAQTGTGEETGAMAALWQQMEAELNGTTMAQSFERQEQESSTATSGTGSVPQEPPPVDVDLNLVHNLLQSHASQHGQAGPVTNLLSSLGFE